MTTQIEIIAIGSELTSGRILNTTSASAARILYEAGYTIHALSTIGDHPREIGCALKQAITRSNTVIITGGLGCTDDDITTEAVAEAFNLPKVLHQEILDCIRGQQKGGQAEGAIPPNLEKLAWLPKGAAAFDPARKISGYRLLHNEALLFFLPGIPQQAEILLKEEVLPALKRWNWGRPLATNQRLYRIFGLEESEVNRTITALSLDTAVEIGYYPVFAEVHLNIVVRCDSEKEAAEIFTTACTKIEEALGDAVFSGDGQSMAAALGTLLLENSLTLATAESCTGGMISEQITNSPGSSGYFLGGVVSYANEMKVKLLGVQEETLAAVGAVSFETAEEMAKGIRKRSGADFTVAVTGIAGPGGGSVEKPVGTVYIALDCGEGSIVRHHIFTGNRRQIRERTALTALNMVRKEILRIQKSIVVPQK